MFSNHITTEDLSRAKKYFEDIISFTVGPFTLDEIIAYKIDTINIVDVRDYDDYIEGHIPFAIHIPHKEAKEHSKMLEKDRVTIVYSYSDSCPRAYNAALSFVDKHYPTAVLRGGFREWQKFDFDVIKNNTTDYKEADEN